ncbi:protein tyrosine phosphatase [Pedobacter sp. PLR]|uniref:low molecular weight protein tyrosine phosphatase family protein n=1 Tax=Pedobacter sp. PLR TaxID=2994465 RepID=UPI002246E3FF|nr:protein tyrosine phosphatase [Pedobacter sp. PLR]MCX2452263.1 protein tyrosine phosphatase [Pedobacter sp. PLR]
MSDNFLFICSRNQWRSRTAEDIFKNFSGLNVRSAGTSSSARIKVNEKLLEWADLIFVMEKHHKQWLNQKYPSLLNNKQIIILEIPDEYQYMDAELINILEIGLEPYLGR